MATSKIKKGFVRENFTVTTSSAGVAGVDVLYNKVISALIKTTGQNWYIEIRPSSDGYIAAHLKDGNGDAVPNTTFSIQIIHE